MSTLERRLSKIEEQSPEAIYRWQDNTWTESEFEARHREVDEQNPGRQIIWVGWQY